MTHGKPHGYVAASKTQWPLMETSTSLLSYVKSNAFNSIEVGARSNCSSDFIQTVAGNPLENLLYSRPPGLTPIGGYALATKVTGDLMEDLAYQ